MNDKPRQVLCDLLIKHGVSLSKDFTRCSGLLRDQCGEFNLETTVLLTAMEEGIPSSLIEQSENSAPEILIGRLISQMQDNRQLTYMTARWVVESWAMAIGINFSSFCPKCGSKNIPIANFCTACGSAILVVVKPESNFQSEVSQNYAGFWMRVFSSCIDFVLNKLLTVIVWFILAFILYYLTIGSEYTSYNSIKPAYDFIFYITLLVIPWLWYTVAESSVWQASLGKKILGLKVTDKRGGRISLARANGRYWSKILSTLIFMVGYLMVAFTEKKQGLHDKIAGTLVVKAIDTRDSSSKIKKL